MVQKIIGDKLVTDRQQTDRQTDRQTDNRQQTDIFELTPIHMGNFNFNFFFFLHWRERTNGVKFIPPCSLRKFASLTCLACRGIKYSLFLRQCKVYQPAWSQRKKGAKKNKIKNINRT